jgi:hypothetical protein
MAQQQQSWLQEPTVVDNNEATTSAGTGTSEKPTSHGMRWFAIAYGAWLVLSFGLDVAQLSTTTLCVYANGREWGPNDRWYVQDENDGDDYNSKSGYWATKLDDDKWFADDGEKVDKNNLPVAAKTR